MSFLEQVPTESRPAIEVRNVSKQYQLARTVFNNLSLDIEPGKLTLIKGPSGSGKTTLLNIMAGIDTPNEGEVVVNGTDITTLSRRGRTAYRAATGQIFQRSGLISGLSAMDNIRVVHDLAEQPVDEEWTEYLLGRLGVGDLINERATQLSGGQAQRIAVVRALAHFPRIVFADEPTASLDTESKKDVHDTLRFVAETGSTVVMVSHEEMSEDYADRTIEMRDGTISEGLSPQLQRD